MPTHPTTAAPDASGTPMTPRFAQNSVAGGTGRLTLKAPRGGWTWMASPMVLHCEWGHIVPDLAKAQHVPGLNGNGREQTDGGGMLIELSNDGFQKIEHTFPCIAFGEARPPSVFPEHARKDFVSTYIDIYDETDPTGKVLKTYYAETWDRPRVLGGQTIWSHDHAGRFDFLLRVMDQIAPNGLIDAQRDVATRGLLQRIEAARRRDDTGGKMALLKALQHMPAELAPPHVKHLLKEHADALAEMRPAWLDSVPYLAAKVEPAPKGARKTA